MITDRIEREIEIKASLERVWGLVTVPGWWIGGDELPKQTRSREGGLFVVESPKYGRFTGTIESITPKTYAAYRWAPEFPGEAPRDGNATLVEFFVTEENGGTRVRVVESGFASLALSDEGRATAHKNNTEGWAEEMDLLKKWAEQPAT